MHLYGIFVPSAMHWYAKDLSILIYNKTRNNYPDMTDSAYEALLARQIRRRYKAVKDSKTLVEVLQEMWKEVRDQKKEDN